MRMGLLTMVVMLGLFAAIMTNAVPHAASQSDEVMQVQNANERKAAHQESSIYASRPMDGSVELDRQSDGHFYADVDVNGATLHMLVDTGATSIALSRDDARSAGLAVSIGMPQVVGQGADGDVRGEYATLDRVTLGEKTVEGLPAVVLNSGEQSLLGQSFLSKFQSVEIQGDKMVLH
jgi:aspartyl protease family protein